jgi:hypothetical protein
MVVEEKQGSWNYLGHGPLKKARLFPHGLHGPSMLPSLRLLSAQAGRVFKLTLYTGTDCQLCDVMRNEIATAAQHVPLTLATYNIRDDSLDNVHYWRRKYQYDIPVLHLDGQGEFYPSYPGDTLQHDCSLAVLEQRSFDTVSRRPSSWPNCRAGALKSRSCASCTTGRPNRVVAGIL